VRNLRLLQLLKGKGLSTLLLFNPSMQCKSIGGNPLHQGGYYCPLSAVFRQRFSHLSRNRPLQPCPDLFPSHRVVKMSLKFFVPVLLAKNTADTTRRVFALMATSLARSSSSRKLAKLPVSARRLGCLRSTLKRPPFLKSQLPTHVGPLMVLPPKSIAIPFVQISTPSLLSSTTGL
jgi:hypothetical protein